jgi:hypothetical protein
MTITVEHQVRIINAEGWEHVVTFDTESSWVEIQYREDSRQGTAETGPKLNFSQEELRELIPVLKSMLK